MCTGSGNQGQLLHNTVQNFATVEAHSESGGTDTINNTDLDYLFQQFGSWTT